MAGEVVGLSGGLPDVGVLLALLDRADAPFETVAVTYRVWRHAARFAAAYLAQRELEKQRGLVVGTGPGGQRSKARRAREEREEQRPPEREELVRIWRAGDRCREEFPSRDGRYGVRDGDLWWSWDQANGARTNGDESGVRSGIGQEFSSMLAPARLLGLLRFEDDRPRDRRRTLRDHRAGAATTDTEGGSARTVVSAELARQWC